MHIVFLSNYLNIHQLPFSLAMHCSQNVTYTFVATTPTPEFRKQLGYAEMNSLYDFVLSSYESEEKKLEAIHLCTECDVLITGSAPEEFVKERMRRKKLTFRYSERIYRTRRKLLQMPLRAVKYHIRDKLNPNVYLLCAGAYAAADYAKSFNYIGKTYKWGYFPAVKHFENIDEIISEKNYASILWVARLIKLKHPDTLVNIAKRLVDERYNFTINIIGNGELEYELSKMIHDNGLDNCVHMLGSMPSEEVRKYMEQSEIFLFTSDKKEGWGAVLNEAMSSGCAVVASHAIGAVPFLLKDHENGLIYKDGDLNDLYYKVKWLMDHPAERKEYGKQAYYTMTRQWNAENAAQRLIQLSKHILAGNQSQQLFAEGICSKAEIMKDNWK